MDQKRAIIGKAKEVKPLIINNETTKDVEKRILIGKSNYGAPNFVMRLFTVNMKYLLLKVRQRFMMEKNTIQLKLEVLFTFLEV